MSENFPGGNFGPVRYTGPFDWDELHDYIFGAFKKWDAQETAHKHKKSGSGYEKEVNWEFEIKHDDFWLYKVKISWHIWDMVKKEVVVNGKKKKMDYGRVEFAMSFDMVYDWQDNYKEGFKAKLLKFYVWTVKKNDFFVMYQDPLKYKLLKIQEHVKELLGVTGFNPRGYKSE